MNKKKYRRETLFLGVIPGILAFVIVLYIVVSGVKTTASFMGDEGVKALREQVIHATATCYSLESYYPRSLEYLKENYGLYVDEKRYIVYYEVISGNVMPEITVVRR